MSTTEREQAAQTLTLEVLFFASLRERLGCEALEVELGAPGTIAGLIEALAARLGDDARDALTAESVRVAVNQEIVRGNVPLQHGDEVAFLPPVTGG
jgi:molybdopterin synthase sulfur carrier subunit